MARTVDQVLQSWHQYGKIDNADVGVLVRAVTAQRAAMKDMAAKVEIFEAERTAKKEGEKDVVPEKHRDTGKGERGTEPEEADGDWEAKSNGKD